MFRLFGREVSIKAFAGFLFLALLFWSVIKNPVFTFNGDIYTWKGAYCLYSMSAVKFFSGINPYPTPLEQETLYWYVYLYGPSFPFIFYVFSPEVMAPRLGMFLWIVFNGVAFLAGFTMMCRHFGMERHKPYWYFAALLMMANELQTSLRFQQTNGLIVGLCLAGLAAYAERRFLLSAACLAVGTHIKLFPVVFALLLGLELNVVFIGAFLGFLLLTFLPPLAVLDPQAYLRMLKHWLGLFAHDPAREMFNGLPSAILYYGAVISERAQTLLMLANALLIAVITFVGFRRKTPAPQMATAVIMPSALAFIMLFNKRTETAGFVLLCPVYVLMLATWLGERAEGEGVRTKFHLLFLGAGLVLSSFLYTDFFPRHVKDLADEIKVRTLGIAVIYLWALINAWLVVFSPSRSRHSGVE